MIGSKSVLNLEISVENIAEPAYLTNLQIVLPENVYLAETPATCEYRESDNRHSAQNEIIVCRLGNIFPKVRIAKIYLILFQYA